MKTPQIPAMPGMSPLGFRRKDAMVEKRIADHFAGMERDLAELAQRKANAPLKPAKPQAPCDVGLFSDEKDQLDLADMPMFMD